MTEHVLRQAERFRLARGAKFVAATRGRIWMIGAPLLFALLGALIATQLQAREYRGQAQVVLDFSNVLAVVETAQTSFPQGGTEAYMQTQASLARSPLLAQRVVQIAQVPGLTASEFLRHASAKPESDADVLNLSVSSRQRARAIRLTNTYADQFVRLKRGRDTRQLQDVLRNIEARLKALRARGMTWGPTYETLTQNRKLLEALRAQLRNTTELKAADHASSFRPHALRNGLVGSALGALLGIALLLGLATRRRQRKGQPPGGPGV